MKNLSK